MSWGWALFTYAIVWWITLLPMLSVGIRFSENRAQEHYQAAPDKPNLRGKLILNTLLAAIIVLGIHLLLKSGAIPLRDVIK